MNFFSMHTFLVFEDIKVSLSFLFSINFLEVPSSVDFCIFRALPDTWVLFCSQER